VSRSRRRGTDGGGGVWWVGGERGECVDAKGRVAGSGTVTSWTGRHFVGKWRGEIGDEKGILTGGWWRWLAALRAPGTVWKRFFVLMSMKITQ